MSLPDDIPSRSWQSALRQLASNWMDPYEEYGSPDDPEDGCETILAAAQAAEHHARDEEQRHWVGALRQLADTLAPGADIEIDPMDPEVSCARIAEVVGHQIADLESDLATWEHSHASYVKGTRRALDALVRQFELTLNWYPVHNAAVEWASAAEAQDGSDEARERQAKAHAALMQAALATPREPGTML